STQDAEATHAAAAAAAGVAPENVYVHRTPVGGAFGRRLAQDYTAQGVLIAKALNGIPVNLIWTREEDLQHDQYRPASLARLKAGLDEAGNPVAPQCRGAAPALKDVDATAALADPPYAIPNLRIEHAVRNSAVPVGYWRGAAHSQNPFVRECFIDELAQAAKRDPLDYRLGLLSPTARERAVLEAAAKAVGWRTPWPQGLHRGIAVTEVRGSYTAAVAEISLREKKIGLKRLVIALDPGQVVNPDSVVAQVQGGAAFALSALFWGEVTFKDGRVEQSSFADYRVLALAEMPPVEGLLVPSDRFWGGGGEAGGRARDRKCALSRERGTDPLAAAQKGGIRSFIGTRHVPQYQDAVQLRAARDRRGALRRVAPVHPQALGLQQAVESERGDLQPRRGPGRRGSAHPYRHPG